MNAVEFNNVSRSFKLHLEKRNSFLERTVNLFKPRGTTELFWALRDVSFEVPRGTTLGLVGHNGSGKSTTLKLVSRILEPTSGSVAVRGRVSALLELGSGFHPDLSGRDNVYLNGSLLGFNRHDMHKRIDEIIEFAELGQFIDMPVKHYSSGMYMRLGFAIATSVEPDILITDEVLAVGDETFQRKCMHRIHDFRADGGTILFVSHSIDAVRSLCSQAVWLDHGHVQASGDTQSTLDAYLRWTNERDRERIEREREQAEERGEDVVQHGPVETEDNRWGTRDVEITRVEFLDRNGRARDVHLTGDKVTIRMHYEAHRPVEDPVFGVGIYHRSGFQINGPNTRFGGNMIRKIAGKGYVDYVIDELPLLPGEYPITVAVYDDAMMQAFDHRDRHFLLTVHAGSLEERFGSVLIKSHWQHHAN